MMKWQPKFFHSNFPVGNLYYFTDFRSGGDFFIPEKFFVAPDWSAGLPVFVGLSQPQSFFTFHCLCSTQVGSTQGAHICEDGGASTHTQVTASSNGCQLLFLHSLAFTYHLHPSSTRLHWIASQVVTRKSARNE